MGNVIVTEFVSIDGVMELREAEVQLLGRVTYEGFAAAWPEREDDPDPAGFAKRMNAMPKYVVSTTLEEATWQNTTILRSIDEAAGLRDELAGNILVAGSRTLVHSLLERDLVDELRLMIFPVVLGSGRRAFPADMADKRVFELFDHRQYGSIVVHAYRRAGR